MKLSDAMTKNPACCFDTTSLADVAKMMAEFDCGSIPVVDAHDTRRPVGTITDRDIAIRAVAKGKNPLAMVAGEIMTPNPITVAIDASLKDACDAMENAQIRRVLIVDDAGACVGILSQADVAKNAKSKQTAEMVKEVSA